MSNDLEHRAHFDQPGPIIKEHFGCETKKLFDEARAKLRFKIAEGVIIPPGMPAVIIPPEH